MWSAPITLKPVFAQWLATGKWTPVPRLPPADGVLESLPTAITLCKAFPELVPTLDNILEGKVGKEHSVSQTMTFKILVSLIFTTDMDWAGQGATLQLPFGDREYPHKDAKDLSSWLKQLAGLIRLVRTQIETLNPSKQ